MMKMDIQKWEELFLITLFRYRSEGAAASSISLQEPDTLPGPRYQNIFILFLQRQVAITLSSNCSRVVTGPGTVAFDPVTGARRRRSIDLLTVEDLELTQSHQRTLR